MTTVYIKEQGARVGRSGGRLVVYKDGQALESFPIQQIDKLVLLGNVQLTAQATATLLEEQIDVAFLSSYGKYRGRLVGREGGNAALRLQQLRRAEEASFALQTARAIVDAKIHNQRVILQRQMGRTTPVAQRGAAGAGFPFDRAGFEKALQGMGRMQQRAAQARDLNSLRGFEGQAAVHYFAAVRSLLDPGWSFARRAYHPPPDPFNALLSFLYSLLLKDVLAAVNLAGLDGHIGFFHEMAHGRPSLALDLMEEWRPVAADATALRLVNNGELKPEDFRWTGRVRRPVELGADSMQKVLVAYSRRLDVEQYHALAGGPGGQTPLRRIFHLQARQLARAIRGEDAVYEPVKIK